MFVPSRRTSINPTFFKPDAPHVHPCTLGTGGMPMRKPWPWYSDSRSGGGWFVKLGGEQYSLGKHPDGSPPPRKKGGRWNPPDVILDEFYKLMSVRDTASRADYAVEV